MIRHCVFINYRADVPQAERAAIAEDIKALQARVPGYLSVRSGPNVSPEGLDKGFAEGFIIDFADETARNAYLADSEHGKAGKRIVRAAEGGVAGIFVFDLAV